MNFIKKFIKVLYLKRLARQNSEILLNAAIKKLAEQNTDIRIGAAKLTNGKNNDMFNQIHLPHVQNGKEVDTFELYLMGAEDNPKEFRRYIACCNLLKKYR
ncbi:MAG: hypothetical protein PF904_15185 [Kiritimatiellae bacterium]|jgi:hypothetical protein|nr:hypothetical protein [Kiritimatiellia bacterium]